MSSSTKSEKESLIESVLVKYNPQVKQKPDLYIVSIGVSIYKNYPTAKLKFANKDARNLVEKFSTSKMFGNVYSDTLTNSQANRPNILKIKNMFMKSKPKVAISE